MSLSKYEITYIIRPDLDEATKKELVERFDAILTDRGAEIVDSKDWKKRRLAYEISGYLEGMYHIINANASSEAVDEFERLARINDGILRSMVIRMDDKIDFPSHLAEAAAKAKAEARAKRESEARQAANASEDHAGQPSSEG
ncbi:hypothetical protein XA3_02470 [Xylocopilactobacillus apicola]|uniref:Small ribosomal subunit protein bS6 n=1 Tax=Xylocopilactobacillus apicola TaxID=2932184 RepID=A0AAU9D5Y5_9LACO|nr:hypothetical protein XA3_02470 [Xylocopilactobacillus apicola]